MSLSSTAFSGPFVMRRTTASTPGMNAVSTWISHPRPTQPAVAFGNLVDLARQQLGNASAEICDACNTVNLESARYCKGCAHKLPAFYAAAREDSERCDPSDAEAVI